jgi:hypothetical protein
MVYRYKQPIRWGHYTMVAMSAVATAWVIWLISQAQWT